MPAEYAHGPISEEQPLPAFDLAAHIRERALNEPTYDIAFTHADHIPVLAETLSLDERLDVQTPTVYPRGSNIGRLTLRVSAARAPLAEVIPFPNQQ